MRPAPSEMEGSSGGPASSGLNHGHHGAGAGLCGLGAGREVPATTTELHVDTVLRRCE